jgi:predicted DNA-binding transcriptional regulator AlpA
MATFRRGDAAKVGAGVTDPGRIRASEVARMLGISTRKVQEMAVAGKIPSAWKIDQLWTFDPIKIRAWIAHQEALACRQPFPREPEAIPQTSVLRVKSGMSVYERLMSGKRKLS